MYKKIFARFFKKIKSGLLMGLTLFGIVAYICLAAFLSEKFNNHRIFIFALIGVFGSIVVVFAIVQFFNWLCGKWKEAKKEELQEEELWERQEGHQKMIQATAKLPESQTISIAIPRYISTKNLVRSIGFGDLDRVAPGPPKIVVNVTLKKPIPEPEPVKLLSRYDIAKGKKNE